MKSSTQHPIAKRIFSHSGKQRLLSVVGLMFSLLLLSNLTACAGMFKVVPVPTVTPTPTATPLPTPRIDVTPEDKRPSLRVVNASLRIPIADVYIDDRLYIQGVYYSSISNYIPLDGGKHRLKTKPAGIVDSDNITEKEWEFKDDRQYTMMLISKPDGIDTPWIFEDNTRGNLLPGKARVRMVHAALDLAAVEICLGTYCEVLAFRQLSEYINVNEGGYNLTVKLAGSDAPPFVVLPLKVEAGQVYSIFIMDPEQGEIKPRIIPHLDSE